MVREGDQVEEAAPPPGQLAPRPPSPWFASPWRNALLVGGGSAGFLVVFLGSPLARAMGIVIPLHELAAMGGGMFVLLGAQVLLMRVFFDRRIDRKFRQALPQNPDELLAARAAAGWAEGERPLASLHLVRQPVGRLRSRMGSLILTDRALRFVTRKERFTWPLEEIVATEAIPHLGVLPYVIGLRLRDGTSARFVVSPHERDRWLDAIDAARRRGRSRRRVDRLS